MDVLEVDLDDEVDVAELFVARRGRVRSHDELSVDLGREVDVLADGQAQSVLRRRQREPESPRVVTEDLLVDERERVLCVGVLERERSILFVAQQDLGQDDGPGEQTETRQKREVLQKSVKD